MDLFGGHVGENLYFGGGYKANRNVGNDFVAGWYEEIMFYDWHKHNCYRKTVFSIADASLPHITITFPLSTN